MLQTVQLTCENGYTWSTSVSATSTQKSLDAYFVGSKFNTEPYPSQVMSRCVKCEITTPVNDCEICGRPINLDNKCPQCDYSIESSRCDIVL